MAVLQYDFAVVGTQGIKKAFGRIERDAKLHANRMDRIMGRSVAGPKTGGASRVSTAERGKTARARINAESKTRNEILRGEQRLAQQRMRIEQKVREFEAKQAAKSATDKTKSAQRSVRQRERLEQQFSRRQLARFKRETIASGREAQKQAAQRIAGRRALRSAAFGGARGAVGGIARTGGAVVGIGGGFMAASALSQQVREQKISTQLANQGNAPGRRTEILQRMQSVPGLTGEEAGSAIGAFMDPTGDLDTALKLVEELGRVSIATGSSVDDLGIAAGFAFNNISDSVKDPVKRLKEVKELIRGAAAQGEKGAIELKDFANLVPIISGAAQSFTGDAQDLILQTGALAQVALRKGGAGSPAEAATAAARFASDVTDKGTKLERMGVKAFVRDAKGNRIGLRDPTQILAATVAKTGGDLPKLMKIFGMRSRRVVKGVLPAFQQAEKANRALPKEEREKAGVAGRRAVVEELQGFTAAKLTDEQLGTRIAARFEDPDIKLKETMKTFNREVGTQLVPVLIDLIPVAADVGKAFAEILASIAPLVRWMARNPFVAIPGLIATKVVSDIAVAAIGQKVAAVVTAKAAAAAAAQAASGATGAAGAGAAGAAAKGGSAALATGALTGAGGKVIAGGAAGAATFGATALALGLSAGAATGGLIAGARGSEEAELAESGLRLAFLRDISPTQLADKSRRKKALSAARTQAGVITERGEEASDIGTKAGELFGIIDPAFSKTAVTLGKEAEERLKSIEAMAKVAERLEKAGLSQEKIAAELDKMAGRFEKIDPPASGDPPDRTPGMGAVKGGKGKGPR